MLIVIEISLNFIPADPVVNKSALIQTVVQYLNSSLPGQNGRHFADKIFRCILVNEKFCILIKTSLMFVPRGPINNKPILV